MTKTLMDLYNEKNSADKFGIEIKFNIESECLTDFRIVYGNRYSKTIPEGVSLSKKGIDDYTKEIFQQLTESGYFVDPCNDNFSKGCAYIYKKESDKHIKTPVFKVYVHPEEMAGWGNDTEIQKLLKIAENNSFTTNVRLVYSRKVYAISNEQYIDILDDAKSQIVQWLKTYIDHYGLNSSAPQAFDRIFGIKRLSNRRLSYRDHVAVKYIENLIKSGLK